MSTSFSIIFSRVKVIGPSSKSLAVTFFNGSNVSPTFNVTSSAKISGRDDVPSICIVISNVFLPPLYVPQSY